VRVKIFDESHEKDLEKSLNEYLSSTNNVIIDIKFQVSTSMFGDEQIYCFSALVMYEEE